MSRFSGLKRLLRLGDDAGPVADDYLSGSDNAADDAAQAADEAQTRPSFEDDPYAKRLAADAIGRTAEQPARIATQSGRAIKGTTSNLAKLGLGGGALYVGNEARKNFAQMQAQEFKEANFEEFQAALQQIRENDSLTPEQKQERIEQLREAYEAAQTNADNAEDGGLLGSLSSTWGSLGMVEKTVSGLVVLLVAQHLLRRMN